MSDEEGEGEDQGPAGQEDEEVQVDEVVEAFEGLGLDHTTLWKHSSETWAPTIHSQWRKVVAEQLSFIS